MSKLNIRITETNGNTVLLTGATSGQFKAVRDTLQVIYPGAIIVAEDPKTKVTRVPVNTALGRAGYNRFGDKLSPEEHAKVLEKMGLEAEEVDADTDTDDIDTDANGLTVDISGFGKPAHISNLA